jgi:hypothetical protein
VKRRSGLFGITEKAISADMIEQMKNGVFERIVLRRTFSPAK